MSLFLGVQAAGDVWNMPFHEHILCLLFPSTQLSFLGSKVVCLLFHAPQEDVVNVLPCESKLQNPPTESHQLANVYQETSCLL